MLDYARHEFQLNARQKDGDTLREHLESVYRQTHKMPEQLKPLELPAALEYIWNWFCELHGGRQYGGFGAMSISYSEIYAWVELTKADPSPWEIGLLKQLDHIYLTEAYKNGG